jgi:hypothetical protein
MPDRDIETELTLLPLCPASLRARLRTLLSSTREGRKSPRSKFLGSLHHVPPFDDRYVTVLPYEQTWPDAVRAELVARGAPKDCYVISTHSRHDGMTIPLDDAINELVGAGDGTILLCIPGRLAYYEGEEAIGGGYQWIVERRT